MAITPLPHETDGALELTAIAHARPIAKPAVPHEREWVGRAQAGDPVAVEWLVRSQWQRVQRLLLRVFGPRQDLEDLMQTTFLETLRALPSFRQESALSTFVAGVAVRVGRRARRPSKVERESQPLDACPELHSGTSDAETKLSQREALRRLHSLLDRLSEPKRVAFLLWALHGMDVADVAAAMDASVSATRSRIFYAQKALKASAARDPYLREWLSGALP